MSADVRLIPRIAPRSARRVRSVYVRRRVEVISVTRIELACAVLASAVLGALLGILIIGAIH